MSQESSFSADPGSLLSSVAATRSSSDYLVPARRWRPKSFTELVGQEAVVKALQNGLDANRVHHAFLFTGTRGVGKTTLARILAKCLNCETGVSAEPCGVCAACVAIDEGRFVDLLEVDAASRTRVEDTRELLDNVQFAPTSGRYKIYLIDEVHMLSGHSFNALLKTLEEPPPHVKFILATTDPQKLPVTILSRCLRFNLRRVEVDVLRDYMQHKLAAEGLADDATALGYIAAAADGSVRDALSLLDQALSFSDGTLQPDAVMTMLGMVSDQYMSAVLQALVTADAAALVQACAEINAAGHSPARVLAQLARSLHRIALLQLLPQYDLPGEPDMVLLKSLSQRMTAEDVQLYYQIAIKGQEDLKLAPDPHIGLEMTLLRMLIFQPDATAPVPAGDGADSAGRSSAENIEQPTAAANGNKRQETLLQETVHQGAGPQATEQQSATSVQEPTMVTPVATPAAASAWQQLTPQQWPHWCARLGIQGPTLLLASHLQLHQADSESGTLKFLLASDDGHLRNDHSVAELSRALAAALHSPCQLDISLSHEALTTPASAAAAVDDARHQQALQAAQRDPAMIAMLQTFAAEIVPGSVKPSTLH